MILSQCFSAPVLSIDWGDYWSEGLAVVANGGYEIM